jgi:hypothetical protein
MNTEQFRMALALVCILGGLIAWLCGLYGIGREWHRDSHIAKGKDLDALAEVYGVQRRRVWRIFHESDNSLRARLLRAIK